MFGGREPACVYYLVNPKKVSMNVTGADFPGHLSFATSCDESSCWRVYTSSYESCNQDDEVRIVTSPHQIAGAAGEWRPPQIFTAS